MSRAERPRLRDRLLRLARDPLGVLRRRLELARLLVRFRDMRGDRAVQFWSERHARYGADGLRGVGNESWTDEENARDYTGAWEVLREALAEQAVDLARVRLLEVGFGTGWYTARLREAGVGDYTGVDIAPTLVGELRARHPGYRFEQRDVVRDLPPGGPYDLILVIEVTQHIVDDGDFARAMRQLGDALAPGGLLLVTSWLVDAPRSLSFYERARSRSLYEAAFPAPRFSVGAARPFRDKFLLPVRRLS